MNATDNFNATGKLHLRCDLRQENLVFWNIIMIPSFIFGFSGAVTILVDMFQKGRKGTPFTPNNVYMTNLAVMDGIFFLDIYIHLYSVFLDNVVFSKICYFFFSFNLCGRPLFTACMSVDCYVAVAHPVIYRARKNLTTRVLMAAGVWTVTAAHGCYLIMYEETSGFALVLIFVLTLPVIGLCDFSILRTLRRSSPGRTVHPQKNKALQILLNNLVMAIISYFPIITTWFVFLVIDMEENIFVCEVLTPVICTTIAGNAVSVCMHVNNLGKLDKLKCWKKK